VLRRAQGEEGEGASERRRKRASRRRAEESEASGDDPRPVPDLPRSHSGATLKRPGSHSEAVRGRSSARPQPVRSPSGARREPIRQPLALVSKPRTDHPLFEYPPGYGRPPQIRRLSSVHTLGTEKLSRSCPQAPRVRDDQTRSGACGFVDKRYPQAVDGSLIPSLWIKLSTDNPQAGAGCPQRSPASPHRCPLFGNPTSHLTVSSERRHTKVPGWAVGKAGKAGDGAGEKWPSAVHGVCRTFRSPQKPEVVHRRHPQGRWTKFPP
jgi:hypothetical protein